MADSTLKTYAQVVDEVVSSAHALRRGELDEDEFLARSLALLSEEVEGVVLQERLREMLGEISGLEKDGLISRDSSEALAHQGRVRLFKLYQGRRTGDEDADRSTAESEPGKRDLSAHLAREVSPHGVKGWLLALVVFMGLVVPMVCTLFFGNRFGYLRKITADLPHFHTVRQVLMLESYAAFGLLVLSLIAALLLLFRKRLGYYLALVFFVLLLTAGVAGYLHILSLPLDPEFKARWLEAKFHILVPILITGMPGLGYLLFSKRVKNTYFPPYDV